MEIIEASAPDCNYLVTENGKAQKEIIETITLPALFEGQSATDKDIYPDFCVIPVLQRCRGTVKLKKGVLQPE